MLVIQRRGGHDEAGCAGNPARERTTDGRGTVVLGVGVRRECVRRRHGGNEKKRRRFGEHGVGVHMHSVLRCGLGHEPRFRAAQARSWFIGTGAAG